jgi:8-oxo-dGTP pyrophosphatase MutT (NUDIX family)
VAFERTGGEEAWSGRIMTVRVDRFRHDDGTEVTRELAVHPGAAVVVAHDADDVYMVAQPREAVGEQSLLELPAGKIDAGEEPLAAARRELAEEIGKSAGSWELLKRCWASPGFTSESFHLFLATELDDATARSEEEERIDVEAIPLERLDETIGRCRDAKSLVGLLLLKDRRAA